MIWTNSTKNCGNTIAIRMGMNDMNIEELNRLAEAATPGPWVSHPKGYYGAVCRADDPYDIVAVTHGQSINNVLANEAYIAAANPAAVLELIDIYYGCNDALEAVVNQRQELLAALKDAREMVEDWGAYAPEYMQDKYDLQGDLDKLDAAIIYAAQMAERINELESEIIRMKGLSSVYIRIEELERVIRKEAEYCYGYHAKLIETDPERAARHKARGDRLMTAIQG